MIEVLLMAGFVTKHLLVDFLLQNAYMYKNKGNIWHPGGYAHALFHGEATFLLLIFFASFEFAFFASLAESIVHYLIDYAKINVCKYFNWQADNSEEFWWMLGYDQYLHYMTYLVIILCFMS